MKTCLHSCRDEIKRAYLKIKRIYRGGILVVRPAPAATLSKEPPPAFAPTRPSSPAAHYQKQRHCRGPKSLPWVKCRAYGKELLYRGPTRKHTAKYWHTAKIVFAVYLASHTWQRASLPSAAPRAHGKGILCRVLYTWHTAKAYFSNWNILFIDQNYSNQKHFNYKVV